MKNQWHPEKIVFIVGRDNWPKNQYLIRTLLPIFLQRGYSLAWENPAGPWLFHLWRFQIMTALLSGRMSLSSERGVKLLYALTHPDYFDYLAARKSTQGVRCRHLAQRMGALNGEAEIIVLSFSSGSWAASKIIEAFPVRRLICLGYPFRNPSQPPDPDRTLHLAGLRTPTLIIQGTRDEYGAFDDLSRYGLNPATEVFPVDSDHGYRLSGEEWERVFCRILEFIDKEEGEEGEEGEAVPVGIPALSSEKPSA